MTEQKNIRGLIINIILTIVYGIFFIMYIAHIIKFINYGPYALETGVPQESLFAIAPILLIILSWINLKSKRIIKNTSISFNITLLLITIYSLIGTIFLTSRDAITLSFSISNIIISFISIIALITIGIEFLVLKKR